jgi:hypothetical protein
MVLGLNCWHVYHGSINLRIESSQIRSFIEFKEYIPERYINSLCGVCECAGVWVLQRLEPRPSREIRCHHKAGQLDRSYLFFF